MLDHDILGIKPIRFMGISYLGNYKMGIQSINAYLSNLLTQNILYAAYYNARTIEEISEVLSVPKNLVEEKVHYLENNGFMDVVALSKNQKKYLTNMLIHDIPKDVHYERLKIFKKYASKVCEMYIPLLLSSLFPIPYSLSPKFHIPQDDHNYFLWSLIIFACENRFNNPELSKNLLPFFVKRVDGSEYIPATNVEKDYIMGNKDQRYILLGDCQYYFSFGDPEKYFIAQSGAYFDKECNKWDRFVPNDFVYLQYFLDDIMERIPDHESIIKHLLSKGFLLKDKDNMTSSMLIAKMSANELFDILPDMPEEIIEINQKLSTEIYKISKDYYPAHLKKVVKALYQNCLSFNEMKVCVLERLLEDGTLKPLTDKQKVMVDTIVFYTSIL